MKPLGIGSAGEIVTAWAFAARQIGADLNLKPVLLVNDVVPVTGGSRTRAASTALAQGLDLLAAIVAEDAPESAAASASPTVSYAPTSHCVRALPRRSGSY